MSKTIKLEDQVHHDLDAIRGKRETFSQAVTRLIRFQTAVSHAIYRLQENEGER